LSRAAGSAPTRPSGTGVLRPLSGHVKDVGV
jgi:hypothetical protein